MINHESNLSFANIFLNNKSFSSIVTLPLIYNDISKDPSILITSLMSGRVFADFDDYNSMNLKTGLSLSINLPIKKEGFVEDIDTKDYFSLDTRYQGKRLKISSTIQSHNSFTYTDYNDSDNFNTDK